MDYPPRSGLFPFTVELPPSVSQSFVMLYSDREEAREQNGDPLIESTNRTAPACGNGGHSAGGGTFEFPPENRIRERTT